MSPIDDELRRTLGGRAAEVAPMPDPLAGIEARANRMHRQRQAMGAALGVVLVGSAALILPLLSQDKPPVPIPPTTASPTAATQSPPAPTPSAPASSPASTELPLPSATPAETAPPKPSSSAGASPSGTSTTPSAIETGTAKAVYYLGDTGTRIALYREWRKTPGKDPVRDAVELMLAPPRDPDYQTLWPAGTKLREVTISGDVATVFLSEEALTGSGGSEAACQSLQQLVWTVTAANPAIKRVALAVDGRTQGVVSQWWGVGCGSDQEPMARHVPAYEVQAPVQISKFNDGDTVPGRFILSGEATVFEANVQWSVVDAAGKELAAGFSTATNGAPARGEWQAIVVLDGVKRGDIVELRAWEASAEDGRVTNLDTKKVTIG